MVRYVISRTFSSVPLLFVVITVSFFLIRLAPGSPLARERAMPPEIRARLERHYGLDRPWSTQYWNYLRGLLRFDLGPSYKQKEASVNALIARAWPVSATLGALAFALALLAGVTLGCLAAVRRATLIDRSLMFLALMGVSLPNFVLGPILIFVVSLNLLWLPPAGWGSTRHIVLPVLTLAAPYVAYIARLTRAGMLEALQEGYILTARAKGMRERRVLIGHALRAGILPVVSFSGPAVAFLVTGTVVVEKIFAIPGLGNLFVQAAFNRDYTLILGIVLVVSTALFLFNLLVDIIMAILDPRIRYGKS